MPNRAPDDWIKTNIGSMFSLSTPGHWGEDGEEDSNILVLRSANFNKLGGLNYDTAAHRKFDEKKLAQKRLKRGDILLERSGGGPGQPVGRVNRFDKLGNFSASNFLQILRSRNGVDDWFAYYLLDYFYSTGGTENLQKATTGIRNLDFATYLASSILLPPTDEQQRIVEVLLSLDSTIAANKIALEAARKLVRQIASDVAARATHFASIGSMWNVVTGRTPSPGKSELWDGDLPFVTPGDINDEDVSIRSSARTLNGSAPHGGKLVPAGSLLVTCIGSTVGKMGLVQSTVSTNQQINSVCCPIEMSGYAYVACLSILEEILANAGRQAVPIINKTTFSSLKIPLLSPGEMTAMSEAVLTLDEKIIAAQKAIRQIRGVKLRISADLLSGRIRVPA